jgi:dTDP-glucose 4,6-dehydratase
MKTFFVTGGCGFIGSCFVLQRVANGHKVINLDKITYAADLKNLSEIEGDENYVFVKGDICDAKIVRKIFEEHQPDYLVNFAAESHVDNSISKPGEFITTNINGTYTLLQEAVSYWKDGRDGFRFLHVSTDEVFGSLGFDDERFTESTRYDPSSPYSASKAASDHLVRSWNRTYGLPIIITNCSNNYGPRQNQEKLIPTIIRSCLENKPIPIYGDGKNVRDWIFVEDHCEGINLALEEGKIAETYCFGGDCERNNNEIAKTICGLLDEMKPCEDGDKYEDLITYVEDRAGHDLRYAIDSSKAKNELNWKQSKDFELNLRKTIEYYL